MKEKQQATEKELKEVPKDEKASKPYKKGNLAEVSSEDLIAKSYELTKLKDEILEEQLAINQELDERTARAELDKMTEGMSAEAKQRLANYIIKTGTLAK